MPKFTVLLILVIGIIAGVYLVQHTQIFKPKAGNNVTRIEVVDNDGNPIPTTNTTKVKLKVTWVNNITESSPSGGVQYFPPPASYISASPNPCPLGNTGAYDVNHCKTKVTWSAGTSDADPIQVYVSRLGLGIPSPKKLMAEERSGSAEPNWIAQSGAVFELYSGASCTNDTIEGDSGCFYNSGKGTLLKSVQVTTTSTFPQSFRMANSYEELAEASEYAFTGNPTTIDWVLTSGAGVKRVYAQFRLGELWGGLVESSIELKDTQTQECTINQFAKSFGSSQGDVVGYGYISSCDVNGDGTINIYDVFDLLRKIPPVGKPGLIHD